MWFVPHLAQESRRNNGSYPTPNARQGIHCGVDGGLANINLEPAQRIDEAGSVNRGPGHLLDLTNELGVLHQLHPPSPESHVDAI